MMVSVMQMKDVDVETVVHKMITVLQDSNVRLMP